MSAAIEEVGTGPVHRTVGRKRQAQPAEPPPAVGVAATRQKAGAGGTGRSQAAAGAVEASGIAPVPTSPAAPAVVVGQGSPGGTSVPATGLHRRAAGPDPAPSAPVGTAAPSTPAPARPEVGPVAAATRLLARGWSPIPLRPRDKRPLLPWEPYRHRRPRPGELVAWRRRWPEANVGVVTGALSGLVVLDVDPDKGGEASLAELEARFGPLPPTLVVRTGGGGRHLWFRHPGEPVPCAVGLRPGLDVRGDGGYVVAPPSIHPSGRPYRFEESTAREPAPLPGWLLALLAEARPRPGHPPGFWRRLLREGLVEGERNTKLASLAGFLLRHGLEPGTVLELLQGWNLGRCRPPLPPEEVARIVASIVRTRERARRAAAGETEPRGGLDRCEGGGEPGARGGGPGATGARADR